jgi:glyoxylase-like metal-dependent hydrolase (beta-lactamase superfamily II)
MHLIKGNVFWSQSYLEIAEGIKQLIIPMRRNPLGKTFSYLLEAEGTLIDTGVATKYAEKALKDQLEDLGFSFADIKRVILTHLHNDHIGLAKVLHQCGAEVFAHEKAFETQENLQGLHENMYELTIQELRLMGGLNMISHLLRFENAFRYEYKPIPLDKKLKDSDILHFDSIDLRVFWTPGHAKEHICLHNKNQSLLFSGDHILPKITSHISLHTYQEDDPLGDYLNSLEKIKDLPVVKILPAHENIFENLRLRIKQLKEHHRQRLREIINVIGKDAKTVYEIGSRIHWDSRPWPLMSFWKKRMAAAETYAHLIYLKNRGILTETKKKDTLFFSLT